MTYSLPRTLLDEGFLDVGDGQRVHWWTAGNPHGKPVIAVHCGPGSGCPPTWARFCDPGAYLVVGFDQRGCGASTPDAADPATDLSVNTTQHLIADMEALRGHLGIAQWFVLGGSWGSTLGLAYAQQHTERVCGMVLFSVVTTTHREAAWVTQAMGRVFPREWQRFRDGAQPAVSGTRLVDAYATLLADPNPEIRAQAARDWCAWEDVHVSLGGTGHDPRYDDPAFAYRFARLVTHYWRHAAFLAEGQLLRDAGRLHGIPAVLIAGRLDISGPPDIAWHLVQNWPDARFVLVDDAGHGDGGIPAAVVAATDAMR
jgi:proline iminopeptidase